MSKTSAIAASTDQVIEADSAPTESATGPLPAAARRTRWAVLANSAVIIGFVVMVAIFGYLRPDTFLQFATVQDVLNQAAVPVILACGVTLTLAVGQFDLSFTAVMGLAAGIVMALMSKQGLGSPLAILIALIGATLVGLVIGILVAWGGASSFIVTLAMSSVLAGLETMVTNNQNIYLKIPESYQAIATNKFLGFNLPVWIMLLTVFACAVLLHATRFGRHVYAAGSNPRASFLAGVRNRMVITSTFVILAFLAGLGAIIATSKAVSYYPNVATGFLLSSYAAVFLGAAVGRSNRFTILGSSLGVIWLLTLQTGLTQLNQPGWVSNLIQGLVLAVAVLIAARSRKAGA